MKLKAFKGGKIWLLDSKVKEQPCRQQVLVPHLCFLGFLGAGEWGLHSSHIPAISYTAKERAALLQAPFPW